MRILSSIFFGIILLPISAELVHAEGGEEARNALSVFEKERAGGVEEKILGMVGFFGQPLPPQWLILYTTDPEGKVLKEAVVARGEIRAERTFRQRSGQDLPSIPIEPSEIRISSKQAFEIAEEVARQAKVSFENAHFQLRCRDQEREPVWMVQFLNQTQVSLGVVYLSARSGEVLRVAWVQPSAVPADEESLEEFASGLAVAN